MSPQDFNMFDIAACLAVVFSARAGFQQGFAESVWPMLRWIFVLVASTLSWLPLSRVLTDTTGLSPTTGAVACYLTVGIATIWIVEHVRAWLGPRLLLLIPAGNADKTFGIISGTVSGAAAALVVFAVLSAFDGGSVDWNPMTHDTGTAVGDLASAIVGTIRSTALDTSWCGRALQLYCSGLLLQAPAPQV